MMFNNFKDGYQDEMLQELQAGETEFKKLLTVSLLGENNPIQILKYKDSCRFLCLVCNSWVTKRCYDIREASVTKANILACPLFTWFCVHLDFNPFSLSYDDRKAVGLDVLTGDSEFSNKLMFMFWHMIPKKQT